MDLRRAEPLPLLHQPHSSDHDEVDGDIGFRECGGYEEEDGSGDESNDWIYFVNGTRLGTEGMFVKQMERRARCRFLALLVSGFDFSNDQARPADFDDFNETVFGD